MAFVSPSLVTSQLQRTSGVALVQSRPRSRTEVVTPCMRMSDGLGRREALQLAISSALGVVLHVPPAFADHTYIAAKRSFERYYPRIIAGVEQTKEIGNLVRSEAGNAAVAEVIDGKLFDVKLRRALSIYATSFSDNYLGERSRDLLKSVDLFYAEMGKVKKAASQNEGMEHYNKAVNAFADYFEVARLDKSPLNDLQM